jgi:hypothetical protein
MFGNDRTQIRKYFFEVWDKKNQGQSLTGLDEIIAHVIEIHPEYHHYLQDSDDALDREWTPEQGETNPFLHMGMHISIHESLGTDRPAGTRSIYQQLLGKYGQPHEVEHKMIDCLGLVMWQAQTTQKEPDMQQYRECLKKLL